MPDCKLCQKAEATQTGSHITSSFFVKSQIGARGNEVAFILTTDPNQNYTKNVGAVPILQDNILCIGCERRISVYPRLSKPIIDEIDIALAEYYSLTEEELDFIINYDIKFRMGKKLGNGDEEWNND